jgi:hypothetical protein
VFITRIVRRCQPIFRKFTLSKVTNYILPHVINSLVLFVLKHGIADNHLIIFLAAVSSHMCLSPLNKNKKESTHPKTRDEETLRDTTLFDRLELPIHSIKKLMKLHL